MDLFMGVLSVAGGPVAMGITGMNLLVSSGKIVRNYDTYKKAIEVILYNRSFIEKNAPTFYGTVFAATGRLARAKQKGGPSRRKAQLCAANHLLTRGQTGA